MLDGDEQHSMSGQCHHSRADAAYPGERGQQSLFRWTLNEFLQLSITRILLSFQPMFGSVAVTVLQIRVSPGVEQKVAECFHFICLGHVQRGLTCQVLLVGVGFILEK